MTFNNRSNYVIGEKLGMLTVLDRLDTLEVKGAKRIHYQVELLCQCDCGKLVVKRKKNIRERNGLNCGKMKCKRVMLEIRKILKGKICKIREEKRAK